MRERFARWLLLNLALALTLLGRPGGECVQAAMEEEALRAWAGDTSLMSEERRVPGLKGTGQAVRSGKSGHTTQVAVLAPERPELVVFITFDELEPTPLLACVGHERATTASARGPPTAAV